MKRSMKSAGKVIVLAAIYFCIIMALFYLYDYGGIPTGTFIYNEF
ncbi:teichoic acid D-Ala incorporation-associated protein DltX [Secundilactobacillus kimchicus]